MAKTTGNAESLSGMKFSLESKMQGEILKFAFYISEYL